MNGQTNLVAVQHNATGQVVVFRNNTVPDSGNVNELDPGFGNFAYSYTANSDGTMSLVSAPLGTSGTTTVDLSSYFTACAGSTSGLQVYPELAADGLTGHTLIAYSFNPSSISAVAFDNSNNLNNFLVYGNVAIEDSSAPNTVVQTYAVMLRFKWDGSLDTSFGFGGVAATEFKPVGPANYREVLGRPGSGQRENPRGRAQRDSGEHVRGPPGLLPSQCASTSRSAACRGAGDLWVRRSNGRDWGTVDDVAWAGHRPRDRDRFACNHNVKSRRVEVEPRGPGQALAPVRGDSLGDDDAALAAQTVS